MKKISLYLSLVFAGLFTTACHEDFEDWAQPQSFAEPKAISISGLTASALGTDINLNTDAEAVKVLNLSQVALPEDIVLEGLRMKVTPDGTDGSTSQQLNALAADGTFSRADLQQAVVDFFGPRPTARKIAAHVLLDGVVNGQAALIDAGNIVLSLIPKAPVIAPAYYLIGGPNDWAASAASKPLKFQHSGKDVYEDPVFSIVFDAAAEGDTWFAIGDDESCDAIGAGDWTKLFGIVGGDNEAKSGSLDYRYNLGGDNTFKVAAGAKKIKVVINMLDRTFEVTPVSISDAYYLIGGPGNWDSSKNQKFTHSDKDVFDDPVFTYVFEGSGSDMWFAFGDDEAIDAVGDNVWNKLFGTTGASEDLSGTFKRRYDLDGDHSFHVDGTAKFYRFSVNMLTGEYTITPLSFDPIIYFIGATDGWANPDQKLVLTDESGIYTGYVYCADPNGWGNCFKFQKVAGDWGTEINTGHMTGGMTGGVGLHDGDTNFEIKDGEGVYYMTLNMGAMTLSAIKVEKMGIIGDFNGWGGDVEMTWNATDYCFEATGAGVNANGWKFRVNADWAINLGSNDSTEPSAILTDLVANGKNIGVAGTTIKLYPTRKTSDKIYCTVE